MKTKNNVNIVIIIVAILVACLYLFPFYIAVITAMKSPMQTADSVFALPNPIEWANFTEAMEESNLATSIKNSIIVTSCSVFLITMFAAMGGYVISRNSRSRFFGTAEKVYLAALMVPAQVIMVPIYKIFKQLDLMNTHVGIIALLVGLSIPYSTFLYIGFVRSVPRELEEAAMIDGCGPFKAFFSVVLPLLKPITAVVASLHVLWMWNEFNMSLLILQKQEIRTIPIQQYVFFGQYTSNYNLGFASAVIAMIPIVAFFLLIQRYLVGGISAGAIKG